MDQAQLKALNEPAAWIPDLQDRLGQARAPLRILGRWKINTIPLSVTSLVFKLLGFFYYFKC